MYVFEPNALDDFVANMNRLLTKKPEPQTLTRKQLLDVLEDRATLTTFHQKRPFTFIELRSWYNDVEYTGFGFSKVCYPDKWDAEQGAEIAHRRAMLMIYHQVRNNERSS
jgi:hypothetical protein